MVQSEAPILTLDYQRKHILAPMVRMGTLPMRLLCLEYGADIVYSEEIVDLKLLQCDRVENSVSNTIDYVDRTSGDVVFRTHSSERNHVVLQIGTANPSMAAEVAERMEQDIAGLDINMGCPKDYSVKGGMGAALLTKPDLIEEILRTVRSRFSKSLTCKIRLLPKLEDTLHLVKRIASTGVNAIAIHGRIKEERPRHKNNIEAIKILANSVSIPVIANGSSSDVHCYGDMEKFRIASGAASTMIARSVQRNPSIFRKEGKLPKERIIADFLKKSIDFDRSFRSAKYAVQQFFGDTSTEFGQKLLATRNFRELCQVFDMDQYDDQQAISQGRISQKSTEKNNEATGEKRLFEDSNCPPDVLCESLDYVPIAQRLKRAKNSKTPKSLLLEFCVRQGIASAQYDFTGGGRAFRGSITVEGKTYTSSVPHRTKKDAEQACTLVALKHLIPGFEL